VNHSTMKRKTFNHAELMEIGRKQKCLPDRFSIRMFGKPSIEELLKSIDWTALQRKGTKKRGKRCAHHVLEGANVYARALVTGGISGEVAHMKLLSPDGTRKMLEEILDLYHRCIYGPTRVKLRKYLPKCVAIADKLTMALKDHYAVAMTDEEWKRCAAGGIDRIQLYDRALVGEGPMYGYDETMDQAYDRIGGDSSYVD
jgi:hypothetical protein